MRYCAESTNVVTDVGLTLLRFVVSSCETPSAWLSCYRAAVVVASLQDAARDRVGA